MGLLLKNSRNGILHSELMIAAKIQLSVICPWPLTWLIFAGPITNLLYNVTGFCKFLHTVICTLIKYTCVHCVSTCVMVNWWLTCTVHTTVETTTLSNSCIVTYNNTHNSYIHPLKWTLLATHLQVTVRCNGRQHYCSHG